MWQSAKGGRLVHSNWAVSQQSAWAVLQNALRGNAVCVGGQRMCTATSTKTKQKTRRCHCFKDISNGNTRSGILPLRLGYLCPSVCLSGCVCVCVFWFFVYANVNSNRNRKNNKNNNSSTRNLLLRYFFQLDFYCCFSLCFLLFTLFVCVRVCFVFKYLTLRCQPEERASVREIGNI